MKPSERAIRELKEYDPNETTLFYQVVTEEFEKEFHFEPNTPQKVIDDTYMVYWKGANMFKRRMREKPPKIPTALA